MIKNLLDPDEPSAERHSAAGPSDAAETDRPGLLDRFRRTEAPVSFGLNDSDAVPLPSTAPTTSPMTPETASVEAVRATPSAPPADIATPFALDLPGEPAPVGTPVAAADAERPDPWPDRDDSARPREEPFVIGESSPIPNAELVRQTGLAWSIGIAFFAAVMFMLVLGWGADLLFDTSPWGMIGGIVIGALIGFVQLFRTSSSMLRK